MKYTMLFSVITTHTLKLLWNPLIPDTPGDKLASYNYANNCLVKVLTDHFILKSSELFNVQILQLFKETRQVNISICSRTVFVSEQFDSWLEF